MGLFDSIVQWGVSKEKISKINDRVCSVINRKSFDDKDYEDLVKEYKELKRMQKKKFEFVLENNEGYGDHFDYNFLIPGRFFFGGLYPENIKHILLSFIIGFSMIMGGLLLNQVSLVYLAPLIVVLLLVVSSFINGRKFSQINEIDKAAGFFGKWERLAYKNLKSIGAYGPVGYLYVDRIVDYYELEYIDSSDKIINDADVVHEKVRIHNDIARMTYKPFRIKDFDTIMSERERLLEYKTKKNNLPTQNYYDKYQSFNLKEPIKPDRFIKEEDMEHFKETKKIRNNEPYLYYVIDEMLDAYDRILDKHYSED